jgi:hypothetical protein
LKSGIFDHIFLKIAGEISMAFITMDTCCSLRTDHAPINEDAMIWLLLSPSYRNDNGNEIPFAL